jgi:DNA-directed RNA polymerase subunit M/transcription elongation factor TFIIS
MDRNKAMAKNISEMGLVFDVKKNYKVESFKEKQVKQVKQLKNGFVEEDNESSAPLPKQHVLDQLEEQANAPKESKFRLPKCQVKELGYYIDKYGLNYKKWTRDHKNVDQLTWRQFRAKSRKLMNIPDQFSEFLEDRNLLDTDVSPDDPKWKEYCTDDED